MPPKEKRDSLTMIISIILGWIFVGVSVLLFAIGARAILEVEMLREAAGDVELWGLRRWLNLLKMIRFASELIELVKQRRGSTVQNLRTEATHIGIEAAGMFAASAFFASIGAILISLGDPG